MNPTRSPKRTLALPFLIAIVLALPARSGGPALYVSNEVDNTVAVISPQTNSVVATIDVATGKILFSTPVGVEPEGVGLSRDGKKLYVTAETNNTVSVVDTKTGQVLHTLHVGENPRTVALTPDGSRGWVSAEAGGNVT